MQPNVFVRNAFFIIIGTTILIVKSDVIEALYGFKNPQSALIVSLSLTLSSVIFLLFGISRFLFFYLQGNFNKPIPKQTEINIFSRLEKIDEAVAKLAQETRLDEDARKHLNEKIEELSTEEFLKSVEGKYEERLFEKAKLDYIFTELKAINERFSTEVKRIHRISNINLVLGFCTTVIAITFLAISLLTTDDATKQIFDLLSVDTDKEKDVQTLLPLFLIKFLPRLSVSIFIELFSFFFLRMYKKNIDDIKYLNNERTNVELKLLSLITSLVSEGSPSLDVILKELSKTERNFILKKDESTVEILKERNESSFYKDSLEQITKILKK
ncbi:hypothetical protein [Mucilaginibacter lacusdianchii]|uniref:hypothetical protein n=1 Tax=Mucilaginibacter lacusdianchii TaxID=2684211 RepID=UPI00131A7DF4|nr:hypothetical protein [Mucilaginibacter sp. JXJ CY 39]